MRILGVGKYVPEKILNNSDLEKLVDTSNEWIIQRTGIEERRISFEENTSDLAYKAALKALENANVSKEEIELIICATSTSETIVPSTACLVQEKLGITGKIISFDINAACSGFVYALEVAQSLLNKYNKALVIGSEVMSKIVDYKNRNTCILFGDGAGAVVLEKGDHNVHFYNRSKGEKLNLYCDGAELNKNLKVEQPKINFLQMNGGEVFKFAISAIEESINNILTISNMNIDEIDLIIPHQANRRIIENVARKFKLQKEKFFVNLDKYGNTSAASIPIALSEALEKNEVKKGSNVLLVGFGAGLTWGATIIKI